MNLRLTVGLLTVCALWSCNCGDSSPADGGTGGSMSGQGGGAGGGTQATGGGSNGATSCNWSTSVGAGISTATYNVVSLNDGTVVVMGATSGAYPDAGRGGFAARLDENGQILWERGYGAGAQITNALLALDGGLLLAGYTRSGGEVCANYHGAKDVFLAKVNPATGAPLFQTCLGGDDDEEPSALREYIDPILGTTIHITGNTDSHMSFDVGPKHGGGGFDAPDMMNAVVSAEVDGGFRVRIACLGGRGPENGVGFLDDGSPFGSTFSDNSGDLSNAQPPQFSDLMSVEFDGGTICTDFTCSVTARRIGGSGNDSVVKILRGNVIAGTTRSADAGLNDAGFSCPGASQTTPKVYLARATRQTLGEVRCIGSGPMGLPEARDFDEADGGYWLTIASAPAADELAQTDLIVDAGSDSASSALLRFGFDLKAVARGIRLKGVGNPTVAVRPDGCLVVTTSQGGGKSRVFAVSP